MKTKNIEGEWFWSGDCLMKSNPESFSSTHLLELGRIRPEPDVKRLIESAPQLLEALDWFVSEFTDEYGEDHPSIENAIKVMKKATA